ncbi:MAG: M24 family metallopeptidase [Thermoanaerobaculia bacterium]
MTEKNPIEERLRTARSRLAQGGADVLLVTPSTNLFYLSGISFHRSERLTAVLIPKDGEPVLVVPAFEETHARSMTPISRIVTWQETEDAFAKAASLLGAGRGTILVEPSTAFDDVERLLSHAPGWIAKSGANLFAAMRMVKSSEELATMRRAIATGVARFRAAFERLRPGVSEREISGAFGGENVVQFGPSAAVPHGEASERRLSKNEAVLIDAWDNPEGYYYDITRSTFYGAPTDEYRKVWDIVHEAQGAGIEAARPGVACSEVDAAARRVIEKAGYGEYFTHRLGHGLGIDVHEPPYMVSGNDILLEPGMTFTSEPGIYLPGRFGVRIEDDVAVTEKGSEVLSPRPAKLEAIPA